MRNVCEGFNQEVLLKLHLTPSDAYVLRWFLSFTQSGKQDFIDVDGERYYWVKYSKVIEDLPILYLTNVVTVGNLFRKLCGQGKPNEHEYPLEKHNDYDSKQNRVYFRFRPEVLEALEGKGMLKFDELATTTKVTKTNSKVHRVKAHPEVVQLLAELKRYEAQGKSIFPHAAPADAYHYTKTFARFQDAMLALYEGRYKTEYGQHKLAEWFKKKYKYYLTPEVDSLIASCKGSWTTIHSMIERAAKNYQAWFEVDKEQANKDALPRSVVNWIYSAHTNTSMFLVCLVKAPTRAREATAEQAYNVIPTACRTAAKTIYNAEWDGFTFWNKVRKVVQWYERNADALLEEDPNALYWLDGGVAQFTRDYIAWLREFTQDQVFLANIGTDVPTWGVYVKTKRERHGIIARIPK